MKYRSIKGTKDILPGEVEAWQHVEGSVRRVMQRFNYHEIRTPVFETTALFSRSIGELTDIVTKEMYTFRDRSDESVTLKPEGTASVLRAYIQNNIGEQASLTKLYYIGPMFRQERPQAGRLRQFHQYGAEALGSQSPALDAEMMIITLEIYRALGITDTMLKVNSVGCQRCRPRYKDLLIDHLKKIASQLTPDSQSRIQNNPLRVLDSKDEGDQRRLRDVPLMKDFLCRECSEHFVEVLSLLDEGGIPHQIDGKLVRGLDYYTKTAFEITSSALGSQDALAGGGRYDLLVEELGGKPTPGVGFAAGIERLIMVLKKKELLPSAIRGPRLYIVSADENARRWTFQRSMELRRHGIAVEIDYLERSVKAQMREANRMACELVLIVGERELSSGSGTIKNMTSGMESSVALSQLESLFT